MKSYAIIFFVIIGAGLSNNLVAESMLKASYMRCVPFDKEGRKVGDDQECPKYKVSIIQLLANPELYDGKQVVVHGFVHLEFEGRGLYIRKQDHEEHLTHNGLWVGKLNPEARVRNCQDNYVTVIGMFRAKKYGHRGAWSGALEDISVCGG